MSQPQRKWLGMLSDLHSTLWELKAYIFGKCQGFVIMHLFFFFLFLLGEALYAV